MPEDKAAPTITFTDPKSGKDRTIPLKVGIGTDPEVLDKYVEDYITKNPTGTRYSEKRGSLKAAPESSPGMKLLETIAPYMPFGGAIDRVAAAGEQVPGHQGIMGGLEDTAANAMDLMAIPGIAKSGIVPAIKALGVGMPASSGVEQGMNALGAPPEVSRGAGMAAGAGLGGIAAGGSPNVTSRFQVGRQAASEAPLSRSTIPGLVGYAAGTMAGHAAHVPVPFATTGPLGVAAASKAVPFMKGFMAPNEAPMINPGLIPNGGEVEGNIGGMIGSRGVRPVAATAEHVPYSEEAPSETDLLADRKFRPVTRQALPPGPERIFHMGDPLANHYPPGTAPEPSIKTQYPPPALPPGVGNRSGEAIPLAPPERVQGRFGPAGTRAVRRQFYGDAPEKTVDLQPTNVGYADPESVKAQDSYTAPNEYGKPKDSVKDVINKANENLKRTEKTKESKPTSSEKSPTKSEGDKTEKAKNSSSKSLDGLHERVKALEKKLSKK